MSNLVNLNNQIKYETLEKVLVQGDLSKLSSQERLMYYTKTCESLGLNPMTKPFDYIVLNGKLTLYAKRDATEQLRKIHGISIEITKREQIGDVYMVQAKATDKDGRTDESLGAVSISNSKGETLANLLMKAETKAKRRVTLSIAGLGLLDETEVETIPNAEVVSNDVFEQVVEDEFIEQTGLRCEQCDASVTEKVANYSKEIMLEPKMKKYIDMQEY